MEDDADAVHAARSLVAKALAVNLDKIGSDTCMYDIPPWDSLGQLSIVVAIEEAAQVDINDANMFELLKSVRNIATYISGLPKKSYL